MFELEIFSDVICPWCFIGKRRLDGVLSTATGEGIQVRWRPYLLYPGIAPQGLDRREFLARRYGEGASPARIPSRIAMEASAEGIELHYDLIERTPNTMLAHCLLELAHEQGCQHELAEALFQGYFCNGRDVGELATLVDIAADCGIDARLARDFLLSGRAEGEVRRQLARAVEVGVSGVPGYYLAGSFLLPGAQTSETMSQIIGRVKSRLLARQADRTDG